MSRPGMVAAIDATCLGTGRGGDETLVRSFIGGWGAAAPAGDRLRVLHRGSAPPQLPATTQPVDTIAVAARTRLGRIALAVPRALASGGGADVLVTVTHAPPSSVAPVALVVTDVSFAVHPAWYPPRVRARLHALVPAQARAAAVVVTVSEFSRAGIVEHLRVPPDRVVVVPPYVETPVADEVAAAWCAERGVRAPFALVLGNVHRRKNVPRLIDAFLKVSRTPELRDWQLVVAGRAWWDDRSVDACGLRAGNAVINLGHVPDVVRDWLVCRAEVLAYPSLFEGFGLPVLEAMAAGTAVLGSDRSATPEVVGDAGVLVDPTDVDALAAGIVLLAGDDRLRRRLGRSGRARAAEFSAARTGGALVEALEAAVALSAARGGRRARLPLARPA